MLKIQQLNISVCNRGTIFCILFLMLYSEFKSQFRENESEYNGEYKVEDARNIVSKPQAKQETSLKKTKGKKGKFFKFTFVLLLTLILLLSATLLYFELFTDSGIYTIFSKFTEKAEYYYCVSSGSFATLDEAKANADNAKSKGAAGYVYYDGKYNVLLSLYLDEKTATEVAEKHKYQVLKFFKSTTLKGLPPSLNGEYDKCKNFERELIDELYKASALIENNTDKESASNIISKALSKAKSKTNDFLSEGEKSNLLNVQKYTSKIKQVLAETQKLENELTLASLRQTMIFIAIVMG